MTALPTARPGMVPPPPPGFVLDAAPQAGAGAMPSVGGDIPPPPPGFVLDGMPGQQQAPSQQQQVLNPGVTLGGVPLNLQNLPMFGPIAGAMGLGPHMEAVGGPDPQSRYDAALEKVRQSQFPHMDPQKFKEYAATAFKPYGPTELSQHGALYGATDEMSSALGALGSQVRKWAGSENAPGFGDAFGTYEELEQARRDLGRQQQGALGTGAEVLGGLASIGPKWGKPGMAVPAAATGFVPTVKNLTSAGLQGAAYGFGATDGDLSQRAGGAGVGALTGVGASVATPLAVRGVNGMVRAADQRAMTRQAIQSAPTAQTLKAGAKLTIRKAEATGATIDQGEMNLLRHDMHAIAEDAGVQLPSGKIPKGSSPKVKAALQAIDEYAAQPMNIKQAQRAMRAIRRAANDPEEAALGNQMLQGFEDFMDSLPQGAFKGGDGPEAIRLWAQHRGEWAKFKRTDSIEQAIYNARFAKGGFATGLRSQFATIVKSAKKRRGFSSADLHAMEQFAEGGSVQDFMAFIKHGGLTPAYITGHVAAGPIGGLALAGAKMAGNAGIKAMDNGAARAAGDQVRAQVALPNGIPRLPPAPPPMINGIARRIGVRAANPLLEDPRKHLALTLSGRR